MEEIDLIFAKGYVEKMNYVKAAKELPRLTVDDMEALAKEYGLTHDEELKKTVGLYDSDLEKRQESNFHNEYQ